MDEHDSAQTDKEMLERFERSPEQEIVGEVIEYLLKCTDKQALILADKLHVWVWPKLKIR